MCCISCFTPLHAQYICHCAPAGVLTQGELDNGRGRARLGLLRHPHELLSGRTSAFHSELLAFTADDEMLNFACARTPTRTRTCTDFT